MASSAFNLGGGNGSIDLVWEAEDPVNGFTGNDITIPIDLSSYDYVMAECTYGPEYLTSFSMAPVGDTSNTHRMLGASMTSTNFGPYYAQKPWYATKTGITLGAGSYHGWANGGTTGPTLYRVYGIKSKNIISGKF